MNLFDLLASLFGHPAKKPAAPTSYAAEYAADPLGMQARSPGWGLYPIAPGGKATREGNVFRASWDTEYENALLHQETSAPATAPAFAEQLAGVDGCCDAASVGSNWERLSAMHAGHPDRPGAILGPSTRLRVRRRVRVDF